jgi:hypothetical protein
MRFAHTNLSAEHATLPFTSYSPASSQHSHREGPVQSERQGSSITYPSPSQSSDSPLLLLSRQTGRSPASFHAFPRSSDTAASTPYSATFRPTGTGMFQPVRTPGSGTSGGAQPSLAFSRLEEITVPTTVYSSRAVRGRAGTNMVMYSLIPNTPAAHAC